MSKFPKTVFACQECGAQSPKWLGRCAECGAWNSVVEEHASEHDAAARSHRYAGSLTPVGAQLYADVEIAQHARLSTSIDEFDRVLGGGVVPGSLILLGGEPGIGKTALVDAFERQAAVEAPGLLLARGQCLESYGGREAYYPMLEALGQLWRGPGGESAVQTLATHAPTWLVQFPALVTREHRDTLQRELQGATRERMLREIEMRFEG